MMKCYRAACRFNKLENCTSPKDYAECQAVIAQVRGIDPTECEFCAEQNEGLPKWVFTPDTDGVILDDTKICITQLEKSKALVFTNCADSKGYGFLNIGFCPKCGRRLD